MNAQQITTAKACLAAAYDATMDFPTIVGTLRQSSWMQNGENA